MQFLFLPVLGAWSDRFGRRPVILISCLGLGLDYIFMALAPTLRWLFVGRIDLRDYRFECVDGVCVYYGYFRAGGTREKIWDAGCGVWRGIRGGAGRGRVAGALQFAGAVLGSGSVEPGELSVWSVCAAGIVAERKRAKSAWHMANPLGSLTLLRSHPELAGLSVVVILYYRRTRRCRACGCCIRNTDTDGISGGSDCRWRSWACARRSCRADWWGRM